MEPTQPMESVTEATLRPTETVALVLETVAEAVAPHGFATNVACKHWELHHLSDAIPLMPDARFETKLSEAWLPSAVAIELRSM